MDAFRKEGSGYLAIQNSRPQTIGYGLADSPLLQLAWIAEKVHEWTDLPVDRDQLLTTVSLYWFTGSGASAAHTLYEQAHSSDWGARRPYRRASRSSAPTRRYAGSSRASRRALERVPARPALPGDGGPGPAGSGPAGVLRALQMTGLAPGGVESPVVRRITKRNVPMDLGLAGGTACGWRKAGWPGRRRRPGRADHMVTGILS